MSKRVIEVFKKCILGVLMSIAMIFSGVQTVFADGEYTIYNVAPNGNGDDEYHATTATSQSAYAPDTDPLVYCINMEKSRPQPDRHQRRPGNRDHHPPQPNVAGIGGYTKTAQASDAEINAAIANSDQAKFVRAVLYYGYPNFGNNNEWKTKYEATGYSFPTNDYYQRVYTQNAIWYYTDTSSLGNSQDPGYTLRVLAYQNADSIPADFSVDLYTSADGASQNFINAKAAGTSGTTTEVSVKINKTWKLSTGGAYDGTLPTVSFTLYEGTGTTGTAYGPLTLGTDGTVTFTGVDTTSVKKFTLVESISGTVTGYTFSPIANRTIDLTNTADGATHEENVENIVTPAEEDQEEDLTEVSVKINKTWKLSTGGAYDGTLPTVSFTLYEGTGTTGTAYGPLTLGEDGTVTFTGVNTTSVKKFTLVESISGTVTGYTFSPIANRTIDLTNTADGATHEENVENIVTPAEEDQEEDLTEVSVKINKTWTLSTGGAYEGTKPEVTFTLYGGEGTTGTNYGTVTLGEDDTAVFANIDAGGYEKFTLVESISGTVTGYTFEPCENVVLDMNDLSSDNELNADVVNEVTPENNLPDLPDTADRTGMGFYLAVLIAGAVTLISLKERTAK